VIFEEMRAVEADDGRFPRGERSVGLWVSAVSPIVCSMSLRFDAGCRLEAHLPHRFIASHKHAQTSSDLTRNEAFRGSRIHLRVTDGGFAEVRTSNPRQAPLRRIPERDSRTHIGSHVDERELVGLVTPRESRRGRCVTEDDSIECDIAKI
jgi:hypothetical protein